MLVDPLDGARQWGMAEAMSSEVFEVDDRDGLLACFDATAQISYTWLALLTDAQHGALRGLLVEVYVNLGAVGTVAGSSVDCIAVEAMAVRVAGKDPRSQEQVVVRATLEVVSAQGRTAADAARIVGIPVE